MLRIRRFMLSSLLVAALAALVGGCVLPTDVGVALLVSPQTLNFGTGEEELTFEVHKNYSSTVMGPIYVTSEVPWIILDTCTDPAEGCVSSGPVLGVQIPVRVDRHATDLGTNEGIITIRADGASMETVRVFVEDPLFVDFNVSNSTPQISSAVSFTDTSAASPEAGTIREHLWDFGDGQRSTAQNPVHVYSAPGVYNVSLTVTAARAEETRTKASVITVGNVVPDANFEADKTNVFEGEPISLSDLSLSTAVPITNWQWDFGDGTTSSERNPVHQYLESGLYTVALTVTSDFASDTETKTGYIRVQRKVPPIANFSVSQATPYIGVPVRFEDVSIPGSAPIERWLWEFGDGVASTDSSPTHAFGRVGAFTVRVTVSSAHGVDSTVRQINVIYMPPVADFEADDLNPSTGQDIQFSDLSTDGSEPIAEWVWDFGDGNQQRVLGGNSGDVTHVYAETGIYTVSLTVTTPTPENNSDSITKEDYIDVVAPPAPEFRVDTEGALTTEDVAFVNLTEIGSEPILSYQWDFGDPQSPTNTSAEENPTHRFSAAGEYLVSLTVITATREVQTDANPDIPPSPEHVVFVDVPPTPDFEAEPRSGITIDPIQFTDLSSDEGAQPILARRWDFGDGQVSTATSPQHTYSDAGSYTVTLTLEFVHSHTGNRVEVSADKRDYVSISPPVPPTASFTAYPTGALTVTPVEFSDASVDGSRNINRWSWDFGDGETSTLRNPEHIYVDPGTYSVTLTVTATELNSPYDQDSLTKEDYITVERGTQLDEFVGLVEQGIPDPRLEAIRDIAGESFGDITIATAYLINFMSQTWRPDDVYEGAQWRHNLIVINPVTRRPEDNTALYVITGGSSSSSFPSDSELEDFAALSLLSRAPIVWIQNIPSQPIVFNDEVVFGLPGTDDDVVLRRRSEDEIIAYSYDKYLQSYAAGAPDYTWPALFPMTKAAVRGMEAAEFIMVQQGVRAIDDYVVTGGSKRGWTTWLTGVASNKVKAIAPIVIDVLNIDVQMEHHRNAYGFWAPSIYPYAQMRVFDRLLPDGSGQLLPEAEALLQLVDPYEYLDRLTMPKFIMNSTGDEFFLPDSSQWYYDDLLGEKRLNYVPNTSHGISEAANISDDPAFADLFGWFLSITQDTIRPDYSWTFTPGGTVTVTTDGTVEPNAVTLWHATSSESRDFRLDTIGQAWTPITLTENSLGQYVGSVTIPEIAVPPAKQSYMGFFVQLDFPNTADMPFSSEEFPLPEQTYTTGIKVLPENSDGTNLYPDFSGYALTDQAVPLVVLHGDASKMGLDYGTLMAAEIQAFIPNYVAASGYSDAQLDSAWAAQVGLMDQRILDEIAGIAAGANINETTLRRAHMVDTLDQYDTYSAGSVIAWDTSTSEPSFSGLEPMVQIYARNAPLDRGAQDYPCIVFYVPDNGFPHAIFTSAGLAFSHIGVNVAGVTAAEIADANDGPTAGELHFLPMMRELLYESSSLREGIVVVENLAPLRPHHYLIGDGRNEGRGAKIAVTDAAFNFWFDNDDGDEFAPNVLPNLVYSVESGAAQDVYDILDGLLAIVPLSADMLKGLAADYIAKPGQNMMNVVVNAVSLEVQAAYATGTDDATTQPYVVYDLQSLLP